MTRYLTVLKRSEFPLVCSKLADLRDPTASRSFQQPLFGERAAVTAIYFAGW